MKDIKSKNGYSFESDGQRFLVRCHNCGRENYSVAVATGICVWCGYNDNIGENNVDKRLETIQESSEENN